MEITVLGSGAWEGIPAPFCSCNICENAQKNPEGKNYRTRPEFLVKSGSGSFLLEISPDIRLQSARHHLSQLPNVFISHWHFDHMYGLHELLTRVKQQPGKLVVHCSEKTKGVIDREFSYLPFTTNVLRPFETFKIFDVAITPLPVYHMFSQDDVLAEEDLNNAFAYLLNDGRQRVAYLGDYYKLPSKTLRAIQGVDVLIADGTYLLTDDHREAKINHMHGNDILSFTKSTRAQKVYFHSISHLAQKTHEEIQQALPLSHFASYDGLKIGEIGPGSQA